ncbi:serine hydrolase domain-containing protein [Auraticoccus monumenti]|uniref:CubicO group peptidase, beta-lactamase class C family n=1 Tax=Auraticoccus monumenti TaxID=675864 RepID=A0A1G7ADD3_9ACTN|nr:serine hydrolase domain-containing protein [Auraticoccus monumenti]SDE12948.1 CubicO group peptidase, beta-lactamase class C family [Auraticoccus monumenti]
MVSDEELDEALRGLGGRGLSLHGVHIHRPGGSPVVRSWSIDVRRDLYSVSKTITSLAVGLAEAEGRLGLDDLLLDHLPALVRTAAAGTEAITIRHLLTMTSGITWRWSDPDADHPGDPAAEALAAPLSAEPGASFAYRGASTYLLSRVLHACTGEDLRDYLRPRLFAPLGIGNPQWSRCPLGFSLGAVGLQLRTEELARVGRVLLDGGAHEGRRLLPAGYLAEMSADMVATGEHRATGASAPHPDNERYGLQVWGCSRAGAWRMDGIHGQLCILLPEQGVCVTVTASHPGPTSDVLDSVWEVLLPALT